MLILQRRYKYPIPHPPYIDVLKYYSINCNVTELSIISSFSINLNNFNDNYIIYSILFITH